MSDKASESADDAAEPEPQKDESDEEVVMSDRASESADDAAEFDPQSKGRADEGVGGR